MKIKWSSPFLFPILLSLGLFFLCLVGPEAAAPYVQLNKTACYILQAVFFDASIIFAILHWVTAIRQKFFGKQAGVPARVSFVVAVLVTTPYLLFSLMVLVINIAIIIRMQSGAYPPI